MCVWTRYLHTVRGTGLNLRVGLLLRSYGVAPRREAQQGVGAGPSFVDVHEVGKSAWHLLGFDHHLMGLNHHLMEFI